MTFKNTNFFSKKAAQNFQDLVGRQTRILISITTPEGNKDRPHSSYCKPAILHEDTWKDILRLEFHDVDPSHINEQESAKYQLFNESDAVAILKFLKKHELDVDDALVHCEAGISRSAAVSKFISQIYSLPFPEHYSIYNKHIFSTLLRVYGESLYGDGLMLVEDLPGNKET